MKETAINREDFRNENGLASWWSKDGAWHVARPGTDCFGKRGLLWTDEWFHTREEAIKALGGRAWTGDFSEDQSGANV